MTSSVALERKGWTWVSFFECNVKMLRFMFFLGGNGDDVNFHSFFAYGMVMMLVPSKKPRPIEVGLREVFGNFNEPIS